MVTKDRAKETVVLVTTVQETIRVIVQVIRVIPAKVIRIVVTDVVDTGQIILIGTKSVATNTVCLKVTVRKIVGVRLITPIMRK